VSGREGRKVPPEGSVTWLVDEDLTVVVKGFHGTVLFHASECKGFYICTEGLSSLGPGFDSEGVSRFDGRVLDSSRHQVIDVALLVLGSVPHALCSWEVRVFGSRISSSSLNDSVSFNWAVCQATPELLKHKPVIGSHLIHLVPFVGSFGNVGACRSTGDIQGHQGCPVLCSSSGSDFDVVLVVSCVFSVCILDVDFELIG
jgi:hypothetical protein